MIKTAALALLLASTTFNAFAVTLPPAPVARDDTYELNTLTLERSSPGFMANDFGTRITATNYSLPGSGVLTTVRTDGSFTYQPAFGFAGTTTFRYSIIDEYDRTASATVTIDASKSLPKANDDFYTLNATSLTVSAPGLMSNDTGGIGALTLSGYRLPSSGTVDTIRTDGSFLYTPALGFAGVATFTYNLVDELGRGSNATVYIDAGASVPVAFDDSFSVLSGGRLEILAPGLLANDRGGIGAVTLASYRLPDSGFVTDIRTDGSFIYQAAPGFVGLAGFDYFSIDELGRSSSARVNINVMAVPEPSTWAMLLGGLAVVGVSARRRHRHASCARAAIR